MLACEPKGCWFDSQSRAHAWVAGQVHHRGGSMRGKHKLMFLCLSFPSFPLSNKYIKSLKKNTIEFIISCYISEVSFLNQEHINYKAPNLTKSSYNSSTSRSNKHWILGSPFHVGLGGNLMFPGLQTSAASASPFVLTPSAATMKGKGCGVGGQSDHPISLAIQLFGSLRRCNVTIFRSFPLILVKLVLRINLSDIYLMPSIC